MQPAGQLNRVLAVRTRQAETVGRRLGDPRGIGRQRMRNRLLRRLCCRIRPFFIPLLLMLQRLQLLLHLRHLRPQHIDLLVQRCTAFLGRRGLEE